MNFRTHKQSGICLQPGLSVTTILLNTTVEKTVLVETEAGGLGKFTIQGIVLNILMTWLADAGLFHALR